LPVKYNIRTPSHRRIGKRFFLYTRKEAEHSLAKLNISIISLAQQRRVQNSLQQEKQRLSSIGKYGKVWFLLHNINIAFHFSAHSLLLHGKRKT
jgi:hypothetical protein